MNRRILWTLVVGLPFLYGCGPTIKTITPTAKRPLESVLIEGTRLGGGLEGLDHAVIWVDGGPVGSPLFSYPKPEVFIPVRRADGHTTGAKLEFVAENNAGKGNTFEYTSANVPVNAPEITVAAITPPSHLVFYNEITVTVFGNGVFPGAVNAGLGHPHAGPPDVQAVPVIGGANIPALRVTSLTNSSFQVFFPDTMPRGIYRIYVKNDERYGGISATSGATFEWK